MASTHDLLILGRGIAGAVLAEEALARGLRVHVFDRKRSGNASDAAAGVVNPLVLRRNVPAWRAAELMAVAAPFYTRMQQRLGVPLWHPLGLIKVFPSAAERGAWRRAMQDPASAPFMSEEAWPEGEGASLRMPHGHGTVHGAAWLDVGRLLEAQRMGLLADDRLTERDVLPEGIGTIPGGVRIGDRSAPWLVRCEGAFADLPGLVPVKGTTLDLYIPGLRIDRIVHRGVFLVPLGGEHYRVGATFQWDHVWEGPTVAERDELLRKMATFVDAPAEVVAQHAGVRPTARDRRPLIGILKDHEAVLNGLGSRGASLAPWCAQQLLAHVFGGAPLDPEADLQRHRPVQ